MAESNIRFALSSKFDGEGFKSASQALKQNTKELNAAKAGLGELTNALSGVSPAAAQGVSAVKSFAGAFASGGIVGGVIQLAIVGVSKAVSYCSEKMTEAKEAAEKYAEIMLGKLSGSLGDAGNKFKELRGEIDAVNADVKATVNYLNGMAAADIKLKVAVLHTQTLQKIADETSEVGKKMIQAMADVTETELKNKAAIEKSTREREAEIEIFHNIRKQHEAADKALVEATDKLKEVEAQTAEYTAKRGEVEARLKAIEEAYANGRISETEMLKQRKAFALKLNEIDEQYKIEKKLLTDAQAKEIEAKAAIEELAKKEAEQSDKVSIAGLNLAAAKQEAAESLKKVKLAADKAAEAMEAEADNPFASDPNQPGEWESAPIVEVLTKINNDSTAMKYDVEEIRKKSPNMSQAVKVDFKLPEGDNGIVTPAKLAYERQQASNAADARFTELKQALGRDVVQWISDIDNGRLKWSESARQHAKDTVQSLLLIGDDSLAAKLIQSMGVQAMVSHSDYRNLFSNVDTIYQILQKDREKMGSGSTEEDPAVTELKSINTKLGNMGLK